MIANLISAKCIAIFVGPSGLALFGQLTSVSTIFLKLSTGVSTTGVVKLLSENTDNESQNKVIKTAFQMTLAYSIFTALLLILFSSIIGNYIFQSNEFDSIFVIFGGTIIFYGLNLQVLSVFNGLKKHKEYVSLSIITSIIGLLFMVTLVFYLKSYGVLLAYVTSQSIVFLYTYSVILLKKYDFFNNIFDAVDWKTVKRISALSLMSLTSVIVVPIMQILTRNIITQKLSIDDTGIWEASNRVSSMYLMVITSSLAVYYLPKISGLKKNSDIKNEVLSTYKFILPIVFMLAIIIFGLKGFIVQVLFSSEFNRLVDIIPYQLIGDIFKMAAWILGYLMISRGLIKKFIFSELILGSMHVVSVYILVSRYGLVGSMYAYIITSIMALLLYFTLTRKILAG